MRLFTFTAFLAVASSSASAATLSAKTFSKCITSRTSSSVKSVGTASVSYTYTLPVSQTTTVTPTSTVTPAPVSTSTITTSTTTITTTLAQSTQTATETDTETDTTTITAPAVTNIASTTITTTVTTSTDTTTVSTSPGFTPVSTTLPNSKKRSLNGHGTLFARTSNQKCPAIKKGSSPPPSYPKSVICYKLVIAYSVSTVTKTASKTTTITLKPSTVTNTITATVTATSTVIPPDATTTTTTTTTVLVSTTTTPTIVTTSTATATQTLVVAQSTYYAACAPANLVSSVNGESIATTTGSNDGYFNTADTSAYDCCAACIQNPTCQNAAFNPGFPAGQQCSLSIAANCNSEGQYTAVALLSNAYEPYTISNGNCGFFTSSAEYS